MSIRNIINCVNNNMNLFLSSFLIEGKQVQSDNILIYDTSLYSRNLGDYIIMDYCGKILLEMFPMNEFVRVSTHKRTKGYLGKKRASETFLCGTNILYSNMEFQNLWQAPYFLRNCKNICLMGVGWNCYDEKAMSKYTRKFLNKVLSKERIFSVRDSYTQKKLQEAGFSNVINTGCPTMWKLTKELCAKIPTQKGESVITTITDYDKNIEKDKAMFDILLRNYKKVYVWLQGAEDVTYLDEVCDKERCIIIDSTLEAYDAILAADENIDYVGTRLHAGIRALNNMRRSIVIAIDNRAIEIAKDTNLEIVERNKIENELEDKIKSEFVTDIVLPYENIEMWKAQFKK